MDMKQFTIFLFVFFTLITNVLAVDFLFIDDQGIRIYQCDTFGSGGRAGIKYLGKYNYRVNGGNYNGVIQAISEIEAARFTCGEIEQLSPVPSKRKTN